MTRTAARRSAIEKDLKIQRLAYFTLPVRDLEVARTFYCKVLGGRPSQNPPAHDGGHSLAVRLFPGDVLLQLVQQDTGQARPDDSNPHYAFEIAEPSRYEALIDRLRAFEIPVLGPMTGTQIPVPPEGTLVHAQIYFDDPDGNHLEVDCNVYPFFPGMYMKPFDGKPYDPWALLYSWRDWSRKYCVGGEREADDAAAPRLDCLNHYTMPVRDLARARKFYTDVLGGEAIPTFSELYRMERGLPLTPSNLVYVRLCEGLDRIVVGQQMGGWPPPDVHHPFQAYTVPAADLDRWMQHFGDWGIPCQLTGAAADKPGAEGPGAVALHFRDPDGNNLALVSTDYPQGALLAGQPLDGFSLSYRPDTWPPPV